MLHEFLANNRDELARRCRAKVATRPERTPSPEQLENGIPLFIEQLIATLKVEHQQPRSGQHGSSCSSKQTIALDNAAKTDLASDAAKHGQSLLHLGYTVDQVVHDYGDLCQAVTDLAFERDAPFQIQEFRTLNRCLEDAIASAVSEFTHQRDSMLMEKHATDAIEKIGFLAHELRNALNTAVLAVTAGKAFRFTCITPQIIHPIRSKKAILLRLPVRHPLPKPLGLTRTQRKRSSGLLTRACR